MPLPPNVALPPLSAVQCSGPDGNNERSSRTAQFTTCLVKPNFSEWQ